jgi:DNA polymerase-1
MSLPDELLEASTGRGKRMGVSDVEANGLVDQSTTDKEGNVTPPLDRIHCATFEDLLTGECIQWTPDNIKEYPEFLMDEVGVVWGHNFVGYDNRAIKKVYPNYRAPLTVDTLPVAKMLWPADVLIGPDMKRFNAGRMPAKYLKRQSLGAWGYRLGNYKGEYDGGWLQWSQAMQDYMVQDGKVNVSLVLLMLKKLGWTLPSDFYPQPTVSESQYAWPYLPIWIECEYLRINAEQEAIGAGFDKPRAIQMASDLKNLQASMTEKLREAFGAWWAPLDHPEKGRAINRTVVRNCKQFPALSAELQEWSASTFLTMTGRKPPKEDLAWVKEYHLEGSRHVRLEYTTFNPASRDHLADRLQRVYGWKPETFIASGRPVVDEKVIENIPSSVIGDAARKVILDYYVVSKTLGMLADGTNSWLYCVGVNKGYQDEAIHGRVDPLGTITNRAAHFGPNLGQTPSVDVEEVRDDTGKIIAKVPKRGLDGRFGYECRELFIPGGLMEAPPPGRADKVELTGTDMASLEFIMLGHYLWPHDEGDFSRRACDPGADLHAEHAQRARDSGWEEATRRNCKTLGYLIIYGGGALKAGMGMDIREAEIPFLLADKGLPNRLRFLKKRLGQAYEEPTALDKARMVKGARGIKAIKDAIPGLADLMKGVTSSAEKGYIKAIDGRLLVVRKAYSALNTLLQGGGAVACKLWIILFHQEMARRGYTLRVHYNQVLWVHDEKQNEHVKGLGPVIAEASEWAARETGTMLGLRGSFRTESKTGRNWAETH